MLSSKQIEIFYEVYKHSSMTAAADSLKISQPAISKTLGIIEKNLNFKLFLRKGKKSTTSHDLPHARTNTLSCLLLMFKFIYRERSSISRFFVS